MLPCRVHGFSCKAVSHEGSRAENPTDSVVTLTFQLTEKMQKSSPLVAETDIYLYLAANLLKSYFLLPCGVQLPVKLISKDSGI
jgi:hypothetical protein